MNAAPLPDIAHRLIAWQRRAGRNHLPWQGTRDPYRVWLSEVMLQQTQVATVLPYYERFLARFADVRALAAAPLDDVLALWSGLGYYSRARNLHRCAQAVVAEHGGVFPRSAADLARLPGIGRSTAAAIAAFCFGERVAILDGNVKRVLTRLLGFDGDLALAVQERALWESATALLPARGIARYTQGLMDLGATLCTARAPECAACPLAADCIARRAGDPEHFPVKTRRLERKAREHWWLWLQWHGRVWLEQRPQHGVWAGLWTLPLHEDEPSLLAAAAACGAPRALQALPTIVHRLTHLDWTLHPRRALLRRTPRALDAAGAIAALAGRGTGTRRDMGTMRTLNDWGERLARCLMLLAALCAAAGGRAQAAGGDGRVELRTAVTDPARVQSGELFALHDKAMAWQLPGEVASALAGNEAELGSWSADRLAQAYLVAADGAASDAITIGVLRAAGVGAEAAALASARNTVDMPDGNKIALPVARAYGMHLWLMRISATARTTRGEARPLPERQRATVQGDCPFPGGPLTLAQRGFVVEGRRDGRLLLQGAIGAGLAWFMATETRYMTTVRAGERVTEVRVPDRPSQVYRATLGAPALRLEGADGAPRCEIVIEPAP